MPKILKVPAQPAWGDFILEDDTKPKDVFQTKAIMLTLLRRYIEFDIFASGIS